MLQIGLGETYYFEQSHLGQAIVSNHEPEHLD